MKIVGITEADLFRRETRYKNAALEVMKRCHFPALNSVYSLKSGIFLTLVGIVERKGCKKLVLSRLLLVNLLVSRV
jgi:hypothetical protein